jgi:hypothetical protein
MSQHIFKTTTTDGKILMITMGYDRPLDFVFCTIIADGDILYSNLDDPAAGTHQQDVEYYRRVLQQFGIDAPESLFKEVQEDQAHRIGNRVVVHGARAMTGEPRWMRLRKDDRCDKCKRELPARSRVFINPRTNGVFCDLPTCGYAEARKIKPSKTDEERSQ